MLSKRSALIMEISPVKHSLLGELLQDLGFPLVSEAPTQLKALELMQVIAYDAVFVEVARGDDSGFKFIRKLRLDRRNNHRVPIIVMSTDGQRRTIEGARDAGAHGFLVKPFSRGSLHVQIVRVLNDGRAYVEAPDFSGPDRRRWRDPDYTGPEQRRNPTASHYLD